MKWEILNWEQFNLIRNKLTLGAWDDDCRNKECFDLSQCFAIRNDNEVVAVILMTIGEMNSAELNCFEVFEEYRNRGIGSEIILEVKNGLTPISIFDIHGYAVSDSAIFWAKNSAWYDKEVYNYILDGADEYLMMFQLCNNGGRING